MDHLDLGDLQFQVRWSTRRKTLGLTVERDGSLTLAAPQKCLEDRLVRFARAKTFWVYTQLAKRDLLRRTYEPKEFVSGEGFTYLGRTYRLKLVEPDGAAIQYIRPPFVLSLQAPIPWYLPCQLLDRFKSETPP